MDPSPVVEDDALRLKPLPLLLFRPGAASRADLALDVDHSMPGNSGSFPEGVEGVPDLTGMASNAGERRDLPVGGYSASGNQPDNRVDALVQGVRPGHLSERAELQRYRAQDAAHPVVREFRPRNTGHDTVSGPDAYVEKRRHVYL